MCLFTLGTFKIFSLALDCPSLIMVCFSLHFLELIIFFQFVQLFESVGFCLFPNLKFLPLFFEYFFSLNFCPLSLKFDDTYVGSFFILPQVPEVLFIYLSVYFLCVAQIRKIILMCLQDCWFYHLSSPFYCWAHPIRLCLFVCLFWNFFF